VAIGRNDSALGDGIGIRRPRDGATIDADPRRWSAPRSVLSRILGVSDATWDGLRAFTLEGGRRPVLRPYPPEILLDGARSILPPVS
jgi:hypothetical protein